MMCYIHSLLYGNSYNHTKYLLYQLTKKVLNNVTKYLTAQLQDFKNKIYELN